MNRRHWLTTPPGQAARRGMALAGIAMVLLQAGCAVYKFTTGSTTYPMAKDPPGQQVVGLALSGGGNRSAIYSAYVIELLGSLAVPPAGSTEKELGGMNSVSFLDRVGYISSVSGGSFANAYYGLMGHENYTSYTPMLNATNVPPALTDFFENYHSAMRHNWELPLFFGLHWSSLHPSNAGRLAGELDYVFAKKTTLSNLSDLQESQRSPYLIFNATNYDDGRRFVMTTIPRKDFCVDVEGLLRQIASVHTIAPSNVDYRKFARDETTCHEDVLTPEGFDSFNMASHSDISVESGTLSVSSIVATSGAFPLVVGPLAYQVLGEPGYLHLIDGGVTDNQGVESIAELFLGKLILQPDKYRSGVIIEVDASLPFDAVGARIATEASPVGGLIRDVTRPSDIQELRSSIYRHDLWELAEERVHGYKNNPVAQLAILKMQHTEFLQPLPDPTKQLAVPEGPPPLVPIRNLKLSRCEGSDWNALTAHGKVTELPTRYDMTPCQEALLRLAACWSVHIHAGQIESVMSGRDPEAGPPAPIQPLLERRIEQMCPELADSGALTQ